MIGVPFGRFGVQPPFLGSMVIPYGCVSKVWQVARVAPFALIQDTSVNWKLEWLRAFRDNTLGYFRGHLWDESPKHVVMLATVCLPVG